MLRRRLRSRHERGAVAVEFALVAPMLLMLLIGTVEYSRVWFDQATINASAFEGAREYAIHNNMTDAQQVTINTGLNIGLVTDQVTILPATGCIAGSDAEVRIAYHVNIVGLVGPGINLTARGVSRCQ